MRAWTIGLVCSLLLGVASVGPAWADEEAGEEAGEEAEAGVMATYGRDVASAFLAGVNGVITWPADPVMLAIEPTDAMREMPGSVVTGPIVGALAGTAQGIFRAFTGTLDIALCPLRFFPMFSIEPRYKLIPGWEYES